VLAVEQLKFIEYVVTGYTLAEASAEIGVSPATTRGWMKNPEVLMELSKATDVFSKEVLKARSRNYRVIQKKIMDKILLKIEDNTLDGCSIMELIKMLEKAVLTSKTDEDPKKGTNISIDQRSIHINATLKDKFQQKEFADKFSDLLMEMDPNDIEDMAQEKENAERNP